jgi:hypothetical protein
MLFPTSGQVKYNPTLDAGLREAVEEGFLAVEAGLVVPTLEGGLEPARREAGLEDAPSTAFEAGFAFEAGLINLDAGLVALEAGLVAFEAGLLALEAGLVFREITLSRGCHIMSMFIRRYLLCGRFALLSILGFSLFATRFGRCCGFIARGLILLVSLCLPRAWFGRDLFRGRLGFSFWLLLDASRAARSGVSVSGGGGGFRFSNHDNRR